MECCMYGMLALAEAAILLITSTCSAILFAGVTCKAIQSSAALLLV